MKCVFEDKDSHMFGPKLNTYTRMSYFHPLEHIYVEDVGRSSETQPSMIVYHYGTHYVHFESELSHTVHRTIFSKNNCCPTSNLVKYST